MGQLHVVRLVIWIGGLVYACEDLPEPEYLDTSYGWIEQAQGPPRLQHTATPIVLQTDPTVVVVGGLASHVSHSLPLHPIMIYRTAADQWIQVDAGNAADIAQRYDHAALAWDSELYVLNGNHQGQVMDSLDRICIDSDYLATSSPTITNQNGISDVARSGHTWTNLFASATVQLSLVLGGRGPSNTVRILLY